MEDLGWLFLGTVVTILAFVAGIFFYLSERKEKELVYTFNPQRTQIVKVDEYSQLQVYFDSLLVKTDLTAAHLNIWNAGELAIDSSDILRQLTIRTSDNTQIYYAFITDTSRDVTNINLDTSLKEKGILKLNWKILEKDDGCVIQILYAGDDKKEFKVDAVIKEQGNIKIIVTKEFGILSFVLLFLNGIFGLVNISLVYFYKRRKIFGLMNTFLLISAFMNFIAIILLLISLIQGSPKSPFY